MAQSLQSRQRLDQATARAEQKGYRVEIDPDPETTKPNALGSIRLVDMPARPGTQWRAWLACRSPPRESR